MKRSFQTAVLFAAFGLMLFGAAVCSAQIVGNYRAAAKGDAQIVGAANYAVEARNKAQQGASLKFVAVERAETQVVAGTNYRLCLTVKAGGANEQATAVVYQNLENKYELTSWTSGNCAAASEPNDDSKTSNTGGKTKVGKTNGTLAPEAVVKNLYAAKGAASPFFQKKSRALVDKYFTRELADLIWKDATAPGDGIGALDFNPLFYAQDDDITDFVIEKADADGTVRVKFKNFGKDEQILYSLVKENAQSKVWKIESVMYSDAEDLGSILEYGMMTEAEMKIADNLNKMDGDYLVGSVKCNFTTNKSGYWARVQCDDQENFQVVDTESLTFGTFNPNEKGRRGKFVLAADGSIGKFVDASGKELKVSRVK